MKPQPIEAERLRQRVEAQGFDWYYPDETGSTNADVLQHYRDHRR